MSDTCVMCSGKGSLMVVDGGLKLQPCTGTLPWNGDETDCPVVLAQRGLRTYDPTTHRAISVEGLRRLEEKLEQAAGGLSRAKERYKGSCYEGTEDAMTDVFQYGVMRDVWFAAKALAEARELLEENDDE